jgi:hypothetical protein
MSTTTQQPRGAHLNGSVPLSSSEEVFRAAAGTLGAHLRRIPDGETGVRAGWIGWQRAVFTHHPEFEPGEPEPGVYGPQPVFRLRQRDRASHLEFGSLGYSEAAIASYADFERLKRDGVIPAAVRFQVSLPTPLAPMSFIALRDRDLAEPAYERRLLTELREITNAVPNDQLAIQWDVAFEVGLLEELAPTHLGDPFNNVIQRLVRIGEAVRPDVDLGYHLCYGDLGRHHFKEPSDTELLVRMANALATHLGAQLKWLHLPVPRVREDDDYFAPLEQLELPAGTELYLGVVHLEDGVDGARRRVEAALRHVSSFGVATECGLGRHPAEAVPEVLRTHAAVAVPLLSTSGRA